MPLREGRLARAALAFFACTCVSPQSGGPGKVHAGDRFAMRESNLSPKLREHDDALVFLYPGAEHQEFLARAGRAGLKLIRHPDLLPGSFLIRGPRDRISALAVDDAVIWLVPASEALSRGLPVMACHGPIAEDGYEIANLATRYGEGWDGPGLGSVSLGVWIGPLAEALETPAVREAIRRALGSWSDVAAVRFIEIESPGQPRSIDIYFARGDHGDGFNFDGRGGSLAHTFFPPPNLEPVAGDMHLDLDEPWRLDADFDIFSVALHETGHALGLGHNDDPNSVMYPYYRRVNGLRPPDIDEIRKLYAVSGAGPVDPPVPAPTPVPSPAPVPTPTPAPPPSPPTPPSPPAGGDSIPPALTITFPGSPLYSTSANSIRIQGTAVDASGIQSVTWRTSAGLSGPAHELPGFTTSPVPLIRGLNRVTIVAVDGHGLQTSRTISVLRR